MDEIIGLSAGQLLEAYRTRSLSPIEVVDALAARITAYDGELGAFTTLCIERARREAAEAEAAYARGEQLGPLAGVPLAVKDLFDTAGVRTTYGSPMFAGHVPTADARAVALARRAGAIVIGKSQTHEFAWGITSVNPLIGTTHNPWDRTRIAGGSSGGSAVALAAQMVPIALGSDTGGSIRVPSAFCGTVGLKPTYGRVSTAGVFPLAPSLDHPGPMARTPADAALLLAAITGDEVAPAPASNLRGPKTLSGTRVGVCPDLHQVALDPPGAAALDASASAVRRLGAELVEVSLPEAEGVYRTFGAVQRPEALRTHTAAGLFPARRAEYGSDVRGRLELAAADSFDDYVSAIAARERLRAGFSRVFAAVDLLLTPVSAGPPALIGQEQVMHLDREIEFRELVMSYTVPQDLTGLPACTVRAGFSEFGTPVAIQLTGPPWSEWRVLAAAAALYDETPEVQLRWPQL